MKLTPEQLAECRKAYEEWVGNRGITLHTRHNELLFGHGFAAGLAAREPAVVALFDAANEIHGAIDKQTYDERRNMPDGPPDDYESSVFITFAQEDALSKAIIGYERMTAKPAPINSPAALAVSGAPSANTEGAALEFAIDCLNRNRDRAHAEDCTSREHSAQCSCGLHRVLSGLRQARNDTAAAKMESCAECGKTSTPDSMWALYCVECIVGKITPALTEGAAQSQEPVATIDYDKEMDRYYIPVHPDWEIQTKGNGSSFRIANRKTNDRWIVGDTYLHKMLEAMARDIFALYTHEGWKVRVSEDEHQSWLIVEHPTLGGAAFSCERGSVRAEVLQEFSIALINAATPAAPKDAEDRT